MFGLMQAYVLTANRLDIVWRIQEFKNRCGRILGIFKWIFVMPYVFVVSVENKYILYTERILCRRGSRKFFQGVVQP